MKRARLIIKEVQITRQGEIKNFQIKLPKDTTRIIAIETDVRMDSDGIVLIGGGGVISKTPYLFWTQATNPVLGKLKLRSMERTNIFYEEWLHLILFNAGIPDMSGGLFVTNPTSLNKNKVAKKVDVPKETTVINGIYNDTIGVAVKKDIGYTIKVFVWVETEEESEGVTFDFQNENTENNESKTEKN